MQRYNFSKGAEYNQFQSTYDLAPTHIVTNTRSRSCGQVSTVRQLPVPEIYITFAKRILMAKKNTDDLVPTGIP